MPRCAHRPYLCVVDDDIRTTETECVYCAVRTGSLRIIPVNLRLKRKYLVADGCDVSL